MSSPPAAAARSEPSRGCAVVVAALALLTLGGLLLLLTLQQSLSWWSLLLALGLVLLGGGIFAAHRRTLAAGAVLLLAPWVVRAWLVRGDESHALVTLPSGESSRLLNRLYPEPDGARAAAALLELRGGRDDSEFSKLPEILLKAYERADPAASSLPTPAIATYLGLQSPQAFDTLVLRPPPQRVSADAAVVLLHGYAGNFYVYCWEMAQAAAAANLVTLCPSTSPSGAWWEPAGAQIVERTLDYAHDIGMNRVYLAGLSNGAAGASELAITLADRLAGLVLISGGRAASPPRLPVLVIQGAADRMMPAESARSYARGRGNVQYHERPGGHFVFLSDTPAVRPIIARFLSDLEKRATTLRRP